MPQVYVILNQKAVERLEHCLDRLSRDLIATTENVLEIAGTKDTAFTAVKALYTRGEADVQIEVRFTAGEDEYDRGKPFDPSTSDQKRLIGQIEEEFRTFLSRMGLPRLTVSVWCKPYHGSQFKIFE